MMNKNLFAVALVALLVAMPQAMAQFDSAPSAEDAANIDLSSPEAIDALGSGGDGDSTTTTPVPAAEQTPTPEELNQMPAEVAGNVTEGDASTDAPADAPTDAPADAPTDAPAD